MTRIARQTVGEMEVVLLNDGAVEFPAEVFPDLSDEDRERLLKAAGKEAIETNFNALFIKSGPDSILVDTGPGMQFGPTAGFLSDAMSEAGIEPNSIGRLVITHLHPDHVGGAIGDGGEPVFSNAELIVSEAECSFWSEEANFSGADSNLLQWRQQSLDMLKAYGDRVTKVKSGAEPIAGVHLVDLPGHTPGHVGLRIESGDSQFLYVTDILHAQDLQLSDPSICTGFDVDREAAIATRRRTLDMLATDQIRFTGGHILNRTIGRVERSGSGYRLRPS